VLPSLNKVYLTVILQDRAEYRLIFSRRGRIPSWLNQATFRKIEQDNCFIIQHIDNKTSVPLRNTYKVYNFNFKIFLVVSFACGLFVYMNEWHLCLDFGAFVLNESEKQIHSVRLCSQNIGKKL
jgi:hypothetical protein